MRAYIVASILLAAGIGIAEAGPRYTITGSETHKQAEVTKHRGLVVPRAPRAPRLGDRDRKLEITIEHKGNWRTRMYREHWLRDPLPRGRQPKVDIRAPDWHPPPVEPRYQVIDPDGRPRKEVDGPRYEVVNPD